MKRSDACDIDKKKFTWFRDQCKGTYFTEYKLKYMDLRPNVVRELIGSSNHECLCMNDLAEFVVCSDENIGEVVDSIAYLWPRQVINYRNPFLIPSQFNPCGHYWQACLEPASTPDEINLQIDAALNHIPATRIYLNQTQLDNYLELRKTNRSSEEFPYIRVSDKPSEPAKDDVALKVITGVFGVTGLLALISHPFLRSLRGPKVEADTNPTTVTIPPSQPVSPESISHSDSEAPSAPASKKPSLKNGDTSVIVTLSSDDTGRSSDEAEDGHSTRSRDSSSAEDNHSTRSTDSTSTSVTNAKKVMVV